MANFYGVVGPQEMTITQDASVITIDRPYGRNRATISLKLDGTESKFVLDAGSARAGAESLKREFFSRAIWEGSKVKLTTRFRPQGASRDVFTIETLSLEGENLLVERSDEAAGSTQAPPRGGMFQASNLVYKRSSK